MNDIVMPVPIVERICKYFLDFSEQLPKEHVEKELRPHVLTANLMLSKFVGKKDIYTMVVEVGSGNYNRVQEFLKYCLPLYMVHINDTVFDLMNESTECVEILGEL